MQRWGSITGATHGRERQWQHNAIFDRLKSIWKRIFGTLFEVWCGIVLEKKLRYAFARTGWSVDKFSQKFTPTSFAHRVSQNKAVRFSVVTKEVLAIELTFGLPRGVPTPLKFCLLTKRNKIINRHRKNLKLYFLSIRLRQSFSYEVL